jgi:hypothetical protein
MVERSGVVLDRDRRTGTQGSMQRRNGWDASKGWPEVKPDGKGKFTEYR